MNQYSRDALYHHGIIGQKWGIRRYQPYGQGGYDPKKEGKYVGEVKKHHQKKLYKMLKKVEKRGNMNPDNKARSRMLQDEALQRAVTSNKSLMDLTKKTSGEYDRYVRNFYKDKMSEKTIDAYYKWGDLADAKSEAMYKEAERILGKYATMPVRNIEGKESIAKETLARILNTIAVRSIH